MFKTKYKKICGGVIALVLILAFGLWGCSDSGSSSKKSVLLDETQIIMTCVLWRLTSQVCIERASQKLASAGLTLGVTIGANAFSGNFFLPLMLCPH